MTTADAGAPAAARAARGRRGLRTVAGGCVALTKPRIIELLLVTTIPPMFLAAGGVPPVRTVGLTLLGGVLAAGSANVLNCYLDRDIDATMRRTRSRPLVTGTVRPVEALVLGLLLGVAATLVLGYGVNRLSAALALAASLFYVVGYTLVLKRRTTANIVWGGAAGCAPALIGWTAVTGTLAWPPVVLFGVVFLWTPPHFWSLALRFREDYGHAGVPMLPVSVATDVVARRILGYAVVMVGCSLLLWPVASTSLFYPLVAATLGALFLREAYRLVRAASQPPHGAPAMRLFHWSNTYLTLLFVAVALDTLLR